jgi:hypothetical protein
LFIVIKLSNVIDPSFLPEIVSILLTGISSMAMYFPVVSFNNKYVSKLYNFNTELKNPEEVLILDFKNGEIQKKESYQYMTFNWELIPIGTQIEVWNRRADNLETKPVIRQFLKCIMTEEELVEREIFETVDWCFKRVEKVSESDAEALYNEFNEWIEFVEDDTIVTIDVTKIENIPK